MPAGKQAVIFRSGGNLGLAVVSSDAGARKLRAKVDASPAEFVGTATVFSVPDAEDLLALLEKADADPAEDPALRPTDDVDTGGLL